MANGEGFDSNLVLAHKFPETTYSYTERDAPIYALGVGACGRDALDSDELKYVYHEDGREFVKVLPTFAALFSLGPLTRGLNLPGLDYDPRLLLHGQQYIEIYKPFPSSASLLNKVSLAGLHDKGKAAILEIETKSYLKDTGELLCMNRSTAYLRGAGGFSNSSQPFSYSNYPTGQVAVVKIPRSQPFAVYEDCTQPPQALLYRLLGDYNPLHSDPLIAKVAGSVCVRCIFRLFGICGKAYLRSLPPTNMIRIIRESTNADSHVEDSGLKADEHSSCLSTPKGSEVEPDVCSLCLGILQFHYRNDKGILVKKLSPIELAIAIAELVKQEGHQIDSFSLEISTLPLIQEIERAVWLYLKRKFRPENKLQRRLPEQISVKDALKFALATSLETLLGVKSGPTSYRIRLTYSENASISSEVVGRNGGSKRRKTGSDLRSELLEVTRECIDNHKSEGDNILGRDLTDLEDSDECFECFNLPTEKFSRNVSQTRWIIEDERMGQASVEEIIGGSILPACQGDNYKFHAAGREDIDVRMLGSGRPFLVEIQNARQILSEALVKEVETKINNLENKLVGVKNLKVVGNQGWSLMHEGEAEKQVFVYFS